LICFISPVYGATPHGAAPDSGYVIPVKGAWLTAWLAGVLGPVDGAEALDDGDGEAAVLHAEKMITTLPITASGDHLVVRDMHSSSNGSLAGTRRIRVLVGASDPRAFGPRAAGRGCPEA